MTLQTATTTLSATRPHGRILPPRAIDSVAIRIGTLKLSRILQAALKRDKARLISQVVAAYERTHKATSTDLDAVDAIMGVVDVDVLRALPEAVEPVLREAYRDAGHDAVRTVAVGVRAGRLNPDAFDMVDENATRFAGSRAAEMIGMRRLEGGSMIPNPNAEWRIDEGVRASIRASVLEAVDGKLSSKELRQGLEAAYGFSPERARLIAQTEINRAHGEGALSGYKANGAELKVWLAAPDSCDECVANEEQGPIPIDDEFQSGDETDPAHPNCSCTIAAYSDFD